MVTGPEGQDSYQDHLQAKEFRYSSETMDGMVGMAATKHPVVEAQNLGVEGPQAQILTPEDAWATFDDAAQSYLGMSGENFIRALEAGKFDDDPERPEVVSLIMLRPGGR